MHKFGRIFLPISIVLMLLAITAGLERGGLHSTNLNLVHPLGNLHFLIFFAGFFGTLLSVESAVGQRKRILFFIPATIILGLILYITTGVWFLFVAGSIAFSIPSIIVYRSRREYITFVLACFLFAVGAILYVFNFYYPSAIAYIYFLVFYILSERLELAKIVGANKRSFRHFLANEIIVVGLVFFSVYYAYLALRILGAVVFLLTFWFIRNDLARRTLRSREPAKYSAVAMLFGYFWLAFGNLLFFISPSTFWGEGIHSITLGFVFSMVFAHAPIIFPNVGMFKFYFSKILYYPLALLHISVATRFVSHIFPKIKPLALYFNFFAIIFFFAIFIALVVRSKRESIK
ncbi:hypothetical protein D9V84_08615 [Bacteroidetes/Chlorobi group bacterium Naka2016]|jgi:hypothetical protein|nr:MAG: hypothetical protein D9V84_08615 [Bacteroidetes/Chlorobi group bacterium Naka2016]